MNSLKTLKTLSAYTHLLPLVAMALTLAVPASADSDKARRGESRGSYDKIRVVPDQGLYSVDVDIWTNKGDGARYCIGEDIDISFRTNIDSWVAVFNTNSRGETQRLFPNRYDREHYVRGGKTYSLPIDGYSFKIEGPTGRESLKVVAATSRKELRRAVKELVYGPQVRPTAHDDWRNDRFRRNRSAKADHKVYTTDRSYANRVDVRGDNKIVIVPDDVSFAVVNHKVSHRCLPRPQNQRPYRR